MSRSMDERQIRHHTHPHAKWSVICLRTHFSTSICLGTMHCDFVGPVSLKAAMAASQNRSIGEGDEIADDKWDTQTHSKTPCAKRLMPFGDRTFFLLLRGNLIFCTLPLSSVISIRTSGTSSGKDAWCVALSGVLRALFCAASPLTARQWEGVNQNTIFALFLGKCMANWLQNHRLPVGVVVSGLFF